MRWGVFSKNIERHVAPVDDNDFDFVKEGHVFSDACWCDYDIYVTKQTIVIIHESQDVIVKDSNLNVIV